MRPDVQAFFEQYAMAGDTLDTSALGECFHDVFLNLDPNNVGPIDRDTLVRALPMREKLFASIGGRGMALTSLDETPLDDMHTLVETSWSVRFDDPGAAPLTLTATFLLRREDGRWRIVVYLNHHDVAATVAARVA